MKKLNCTLFLSVVLAALCYSACKHPTNLPNTGDGNFPTEVADIIMNKCATAGCHNAATASGGIVMDSWDNLFKGGNNGAVVIPFRPDVSSMMYFINTDSANGPIAIPTMPVNGTPLTQTEYNIIKNWIASGAPNANGIIPFADKPDTRQKLYVTQQGCDEVAVVDAATNVVMRSFTIGNQANIENPHSIRIDNEGKYGYVCMATGSVFQKFDTKTDAIVATLELGEGKWNAMHLSEDGNHALVVDWPGTGGGRIVKVNTVAMSIDQVYDVGMYNIIQNPHGVAPNKNFDTFYATRQTGNSLLKFSMDGSYFKTISMDKNPPSFSPSSLDPHEIIFTPDYSKYFVTCESSNDVRVMDPYADTVLAVIPVGIKPQEFTIAKNSPYLFVSCMEDNNPNILSRGSVYVINYQTLQVVDIIYNRLFQPHGLTVDEVNNKLLVVNRNFDPNGPAPHHSGSCGGRNGYYTFYDLTTFNILYGGKKYEVLPDPYAADTRFK